MCGHCFAFVLFLQMNLTLSFPSWRRAWAEAVHPEIAFYSPSQCSFWPLFSSPSNGRPISVTMPTSLGKVHTVSGWERGEWVRSKRRSKCSRSKGARFWNLHFQASPCECAYELCEAALKEVHALGDTDWTVFCIKVSLNSQVQVCACVRVCVCVAVFLWVCSCVCLSRFRGELVESRLPLKAFIQP